MIETIILIELALLGLYILTQWKWGNKMETINKRKDNYIIVKDNENDYDVISKVITVYYKDKQGKRKHLKLDQIIERVQRIWG